ncbi:MAG: cyclic nucleotide-binding/CBS domain-containing protein [Candidatus Bathyarchaeia archaeon]
MDLELSPNLIVREAMSSPVVSIDENSDLVNTARLMRERNVGAIIIVSGDGQPVGIVTERDIVNRVVAEGKNPNSVKAKTVMSSPLRVVEPDVSLLEAMNLMDKLHIRRLGVTYKGELVGVVSDRDMMRIMPTIVEIEKERSKIKETERVPGPSTVGYCNRCEAYSTSLQLVNGEFLCEECRLEVL